ncbi:MAG: glucose-1-phosphate cytidylyltransferase, partial [Zoogloea sp.]|nr:glucose-1-phosphate cytidylyltransferase [Zoogloea sp.]
DMTHNRMEIHERHAEPWRVTLVDTGDTTQTGGRLGRVRQYLEDEEAFCFTYGDGVADIDVSAELAFHRSHGKLATVAAVQPPGRFGSLELKGDAVSAFVEKPLGDGGFINGGFFVLSPKVLDLIEGDQTIFEGPVIGRLIADGQLCAFEHTGFWRPMDTLRDKTVLEDLWTSGNAPWKTW